MDLLLKPPLLLVIVFFCPFMFFNNYSFLFLIMSSVLICSVNPGWPWDLYLKHLAKEAAFVVYVRVEVTECGIVFSLREACDVLYYQYPGRKLDLKNLVGHLSTHQRVLDARR